MGNRTTSEQEVVQRFRYEGIFKKEPKPDMVSPVECPVCEGYGQYNRYKTRLRDDQMLYSRILCPQCLGVGYVEKGSPDEVCKHVWKPAGYSRESTEPVRIICEMCGAVREYGIGE